ncbi:glycosyltransferase [Streptomyces caniferus]|uniref:glycosyltransferase family 2 protein n=1 Tax=Streptomyces caniferus TaxID=285557 RepID=UPI0034550EA0
MSETGTGAVPRFSIVVPVYKVQGFLRECMDSVLTQDHPDFELIAVDGCSPDRSGAKKQLAEPAGSRRVSTTSY